jgi:CrcB protein
VNVTGCFVIGLLAQLSETRGVPSGQARTFVFVGILGGYTTFSSFGNETLNLLRGGEALASAANAGGQLVLGLLAVALGRAAAQLLWR